MNCRPSVLGRLIGRVSMWHERCVGPLPRPRRQRPPARQFQARPLPRQLQAPLGVHRHSPQARPLARQLQVPLGFHRQWLQARPLARQLQAPLGFHRQWLQVRPFARQLQAPLGLHRHSPQARPLAGFAPLNALKAFTSRVRPPHPAQRRSRHHLNPSVRQRRGHEGALAATILPQGTGARFGFACPSQRMER